MKRTCAATPHPPRASHVFPASCLGMKAHTLRKSELIPGCPAGFDESSLQRSTYPVNSCQAAFTGQVRMISYEICSVYGIKRYKSSKHCVFSTNDIRLTAHDSAHRFGGRERLASGADGNVCRASYRNSCQSLKHYSRGVSGSAMQQVVHQAKQMTLLHHLSSLIIR